MKIIMKNYVGMYYDSKKCERNAHVMELRCGTSERRKRQNCRIEMHYKFLKRKIASLICYRNIADIPHTDA